MHDTKWHLPLVLAAYIAEQDLGLRSDALIYYNRAADRDTGYDSYLYYHMGKYFESRVSDKKIAMEYYQTAYRIDPENYRALYKIAFLNEYIPDYEKCKHIYNAIIQRFSKTGFSCNLQPMEIEYVLKAYCRMIRIERINLENFSAAADLIKKALDHYERIKTSGNLFFFNFYGTAMLAEDMFQIMENRIPLKCIQRERQMLEEQLSI